MTDFNSINIEAVYGFVDRLETASHEENPDLKTWWKLIRKLTSPAHTIR